MKAASLFVTALFVWMAVYPCSLNSQTAHGPVIDRRYEYVVPDQAIFVYDIDNRFQQVKHIALPQLRGVRGLAVSPSSHTLYISYGGDGSAEGTGSLLAYDLLSDKVLWTRHYSTGIDSMAITPDGKTIYMPTGELSSGNVWSVINAADGDITADIAAGKGPHNTVVSLDGQQVYMGGRSYPYLIVARTRDNTVIQKIGPLLGDGVRPFTVNGTQTLAFTTATHFLGFQVGDVATGKVLYTVPVSGFSWSPETFHPSTPSHGISLSPNETEIYVVDSPNSYVHVFDVSGLPSKRPVQVANIPLHTLIQGSESPCAYDCAKDSWIRHSLDGRYVFVGDSGDVIDTATRQVVGNMAALAQTRKSIEVDWAAGVPVATSTRSGLGYVTTSAPSPSTRP